MKYDDERKQEMWDWFHEHFIEPTMCVPRMSETHGYQYVCGGPYYANDMLHNEFGKKHPKELIDEVVADIDATGDEWAKKAHYDYK